MNWPKITMVAVCLLGLSLTQVAEAWRGGHGRHGGGGVDIVIDPFGWPYYPPPVYYPQPVYVPPPPPPVYIERAPARQVAPPPSYWYYCTNPQGYYPTIKECPGGWLKVVPQTPSTP